MEWIGRLCVGLGFLWVALVLIVGLLGGLDKPSTWVGFLAVVSGWPAIWHAYLALTYVVVPAGLLVYLKDLLGDPVALWVKAAAPGALVALYALFLTTALPDVGRPWLTGVEGLVPLAGLGSGVEATGSWFVRFLALLAVLGGIPGGIGALVTLLTGVGRAGRRS
jgi:hypothetical protein